MQLKHSSVLFLSSSFLFPIEHRRMEMEEEHEDYMKSRPILDDDDYDDDDDDMSEINESLDTDGNGGAAAPPADNSSVFVPMASTLTNASATAPSLVVPQQRATTKIIIKGLHQSTPSVSPVCSVTTTTTTTIPPVANDDDDEVLRLLPANDKEPTTTSALEVNDVDDITIDEAHQQRTSTPKIKREILQLQKMVNDSKILTEFIGDGGELSPRNRKAKHRHTSATRAADELDSSCCADNESIASKSSSHCGGGGDDRSRSRSRSINRSPMGGAAASGMATLSSSSSIATASSAEKNRRNMRSQNAEFTAKHQQFLRGIQSQQQDTADEDDESDDDDHHHMNNSGSGVDATMVKGSTTVSLSVAANSTAASSIGSPDKSVSDAGGSDALKARNIQPPPKVCVMKLQLNPLLSK